MNTEIENKNLNFKSSLTSWILTKVVNILIDGVLIKILFDILCIYTNWSAMYFKHAIIISIILHLITKNKLNIKVKGV